MTEIGSEYCFESVKNGEGIRLPLKENGIFVFSGRTAIEAVLAREPSIQKAMLPSFCCDSMIEPFRRVGIKVTFFPVFYESELKYTLDIPPDVDCIFWCNYFGFRVIFPDFSSFISRGGVVIEDITHSFFSTNQYHTQSHYVVASLRKWEPILCGGYVASKHSGVFQEYWNPPPDLFVQKKNKAMTMKTQYLAGEKGINKQDFFRMFRDSNEWLANNYSGLSIDKRSKIYLDNVNYEADYIARVRNAHVLYAGIRNHPEIKFLFPPQQMDCPLFVPVVIQSGDRDKIRQKLINERIYCPVHWPHPKSECESNLYDIELSLICDQRYSVDDMQRIVNVLCGQTEERG